MKMEQKWSFVRYVNATKIKLLMFAILCHQTNQYEEITSERKFDLVAYLSFQSARHTV